ncbi:MAG: CRISPR-associated endoribonuclease Cas6 [Candidatus Bathyarchaeia archaeon]
MPSVIGLEMYAEGPVIMPPFTGHVARGLLLHMVRGVDPALSGLLHEFNISKPYSVTPLRFRSSGRGLGGYILDPSFPCRVEFRLLRDELADLLLRFFQRQSSLLIYDTTFQLSSLRFKSKSYRELEREAKAADRFRLIFSSPTYLAVMSSKFNCLFPDPFRVFANLMRTWNHFTDARHFDKDEYEAYRSWLERNIGICEYKLRTRLAPMRKKRAVGFTGWATYEMKDPESEWGRVTCTLARYAEFANVGGNRTGGFGVVKFMPRMKAE